jgi:hypothetical protein
MTASVSLAGATSQSPAALETPGATGQATPATSTDLPAAGATTQANPALVATPAAAASPAPASAEADAGKAPTRTGATSAPPTPIMARPTAGGDSSASASGGQTPSGGQNGGAETPGARDVGHRVDASEAASQDSSPDPVANNHTLPEADGSVIATDTSSVAAANQTASVHRTSASVAGASEVSTAATADPANADRLLDQVIGQIRLHGGNVVPSLETRFHDSQLGSLRLVLVGRAGETIHAELIAADPATANAISRAADRAMAGSLSLAGIDLRIRAEGGSFQANAGNHGRPDEAAAGFSGDDSRNATGTFRNGTGDDAGSDRGSSTTSDSARLAARLAPAIARSTPANVRTRAAGLDVWA